MRKGNKGNKLKAPELSDVLPTDSSSPYESSDERDLSPNRPLTPSSSSDQPGALSSSDLGGKSNLPLPRTPRARTLSPISEKADQISPIIASESADVGKSPKLQEKHAVVYLVIYVIFSGSPRRLN